MRFYSSRQSPQTAALRTSLDTSLMWPFSSHAYHSALILASAAASLSAQTGDAASGPGGQSDVLRGQPSAVG